MKLNYIGLIFLSVCVFSGCGIMETADLIKSEISKNSSEKKETVDNSEIKAETDSKPNQEISSEKSSSLELPVIIEKESAQESQDSLSGSKEVKPSHNNSQPQQPTQKDYFFDILPGEWNGFLGDGDTFCLTIASDMAFNYEYSNGLGAGEYSGIIIPAWIYRNEKTEVPDQLTFQVESGTDSAKGGSYAFGFTNLNGMLNMYLEPVIEGTREYDEEDTMFGILAFDGGFFLDRTIDESQSPFEDSPLKNETFYVKYWGGEYYTTNELWLERVEYDVSGKFFASQKNKAIKYKMSDPEFTLFDLDAQWQEVYIISTDADGNIRYMDPVDEYNLLRDHFETSIDEMWDILETEITEFNELVEQGFETFISQEMSEINGRICYDCLLGTTSWPDKYEKTFDIEACYSVDIVRRKVYKYDYESGLWSPAK